MVHVLEIRETALLNLCVLGVIYRAESLFSGVMCCIVEENYGIVVSLLLLIVLSSFMCVLLLDCLCQQ
jgi:hypothetical protein